MLNIPFNFERTLLAVFLMSAVRSSSSCLVSEADVRDRDREKRGIQRVKIRPNYDEKNVTEMSLLGDGDMLEYGIFKHVRVCVSVSVCLLVCVCY